MNLIDRLARHVSPSWALKREQARHILAAYEAAQKKRNRKPHSDNRSGDGVTGEAGASLRGQARHLDQNHDIAKGVLTTLVNNIVGAKGIGIEPQPLTMSGEIHQEFSEELVWYFREWSRFPEVTHEMSWAKCQRMVARTWLRDGEILTKSLMGNVPGLRHRTKVPYSLEFLEADFLSEESLAKERITQGVERNAWGQPRFYHLYDEHPGDLIYTRGLKTRRVSADVIDHLKMTDRLRQARGVSIFASVMTRLADIKDYEESERIAAKIAAAMAAYIRKGSSDSYIPNDDEDNRVFEFSPGMIWDNLMPGEDVGTIETNRPSIMLEPFRNAMLKAVAAGTGSGYSSIAKSYDGTYSAQRQELVEQWSAYAVLSNDFIQGHIEPIWRRFVQMAIASQVVQVPGDVDIDTLFDADYLTPSMPWIDPKKEFEGFAGLIGQNLTSPQKIIRQRGDNPSDVLDQIQKWNRELERRGIRTEELKRSQPENEEEKDDEK